jgi:hypothetical protein
MFVRIVTKSGPESMHGGANARVRPILFAILAAIACRGEPRPDGGVDIARLVDSLTPAVEQAVGLAFKSTPRSEMVSRDDVRRYILDRLDAEFPASRREGVEAAYRLFGLLPDSLDLETLLLDLYTEQVAGYYDPRTSTLYGVIGGDAAQLRLVLAHELVHALQHQYLPLDTLMQSGDNGDRTAATQAVLEGHATLASITLLTGGGGLTDTPEFWENYREQVRLGQQQMPVFARAPLVLREALIFPYVGGAEFMRWWKDTRGTPLPDRDQLPRSTEQVLHPARYPADAPVGVGFADSTMAAQFEDTLGELEAAIMLAAFRGAGQASYDLPLGWGGDRYRLYQTSTGPALVWYSVWDSPVQRDRFHGAIEPGFAAMPRAGYRAEVTRVDIGGRPGLRVVNAPTDWAGWGNLPAARTQEQSESGS